MSLRGVLRGFGLKVGPTTTKTFEGRVRDLVAQHDTLRTIAEALLKARAVLAQEFKAIERRLYALARASAPTRRLMTTPGVGAIVALTFAAGIDDPAIRHDDCGAFLVPLVSPEDGLMVSPSGIRSTGSTKVRAGR